MGGDGGKGCASYIRTQYSNRIPMGGNGGDGGGVIIKSSDKISNLNTLKRAHYKATHGKAGMSKNCGGKNGGDTTIKVPVGTLVYEIPELSKDLKNFGIAYPLLQTYRKDYKRKLIVDMDVNNKMFLVAKGGKGGRGNHDVKPGTTNREGEKGETKVLVMITKQHRSWC